MQRYTEYLTCANFSSVFFARPALAPAGARGAVGRFPVCGCKGTANSDTAKTFCNFFLPPTPQQPINTLNDSHKNHKKNFQYFPLATSQTSPKGLIAPMGGNHADEAKKNTHMRRPVVVHVLIPIRSAKLCGALKHEKHRGGLPCGWGREAPKEHWRMT